MQGSPCWHLLTYHTPGARDPVCAAHLRRNGHAWIGLVRATESVTACSQWARSTRRNYRARKHGKASGQVQSSAHSFALTQGVADDARRGMHEGARRAAPNAQGGGAGARPGSHCPPLPARTRAARAVPTRGGRTFIFRMPKTTEPPPGPSQFRHRAQRAAQTTVGPPRPESPIRSQPPAARETQRRGVLGFSDGQSHRLGPSHAAPAAEAVQRKILRS
jgi:hypothetical protein